MSKEHAAKVEEALQRSREACAELTRFVKGKWEHECSPTFRKAADALRRKWAQLYDEYAKLRDEGSQ